MLSLASLRERRLRDMSSFRVLSMKNRRRLVIILTYATAVFLAAKAQSTAVGLTTQITLAALYRGPAVILHFAINWIWGDEKPKDNSDGEA